MKNYMFIAVDHQGQVVRGELKATSSDTAQHQLIEKRLNVVRVKEKTQSSLRNILATDIQLVPLLRKKEEILFLSTLGELIDAGLPMSRTLSVCIEVQSRTSAKTVISAIMSHVHHGKSLSEAMSLQAPCFDDRLLALVAAGEESGQLGTALTHIAKDMEKQNAQTAKIKGALYYPAFLMVMSVLAIALLVGFVLPQFEPLFQQAGAELPAITRGVQVFANLMVTYGPWMMLALVLFIALILLLRKDPRTHEHVDRLWLGIPLIGELVRLSAIATLCHTLGSQLKHGVPLERALSLARKTQNNMAMAVALQSVNDLVHRGRPLSEAFKTHKVYPDLLGHMVKVGEETGDMAHALLRLAHMLDGHVNERSTRLTGLLVPLITLTLGLVIGLIVFAVMAAVMGVTKLT